MNVKNPDRLKLIFAFFAVYFIWGTTYLASLIGLEGFGPLMLSAFRYGSAALILSLFILWKRINWPDRLSWKVLSISGILMLVGGSGLVVVGEQYINSGYAAVVVATEPLWFIILDRKRWRYYFSNGRIIAGLMTGFLGILLFAFVSPRTGTGSSDKLIGTSIVLISAILWVSGTLYASTRVKPNSSNISRTAVQLIAAAVFAALLSLFFGEWVRFSFHEVGLRAWSGLAFLTIMGSLIAYMAFNWLVTVQPPAIVSTHTYVNPVVAIVIGWLLADEPLTWLQGAALVIVLTGVLVTQSASRNTVVH